MFMFSARIKLARERDNPLVREGDQRASREKRVTEPVESPDFIRIFPVVIVVVVVIGHAPSTKLRRRCRWVRGGGASYTRLCEPTLDLAQHSADFLLATHAVQRCLVIAPRKRFFTQTLVLPEERLSGAETEREEGTWRCVCGV